MAMENKIIVRLDADVREALDKAARQDGRTPSGYVRKLIMDHLARRGMLQPAGKGKGE
jgi:predicted DNA-binding protein